MLKASQCYQYRKDIEDQLGDNEEISCCLYRHHTFSVANRTFEVN
jgi:hypothetical protein